jgi:D-lyxose ketol-isomerase
VLVGEVSKVNDDEHDNRFFDDAIGRFPAIEEDEPRCTCCARSTRPHRRSETDSSHAR